MYSLLNESIQLITRVSSIYVIPPLCGKLSLWCTAKTDTLQLVMFPVISAIHGIRKSLTFTENAEDVCLFFFFWLVGCFFSPREKPVMAWLNIIGLNISSMLWSQNTSPVRRTNRSLTVRVTQMPSSLQWNTRNFKSTKTKHHLSKKEQTNPDSTLLWHSTEKIQTYCWLLFQGFFGMIVAFLKCNSGALLQNALILAGLLMWLCDQSRSQGRNTENIPS